MYEVRRLRHGLKKLSAVKKENRTIIDLILHAIPVSRMRAFPGETSLCISKRKNADFSLRLKTPWIFHRLMCVRRCFIIPTPLTGSAQRKKLRLLLQACYSKLCPLHIHTRTTNDPFQSASTESRDFVDIIARSAIWLKISMTSLKVKFNTQNKMINPRIFYQCVVKIASFY